MVTVSMRVKTYTIIVLNMILKDVSGFPYLVFSHRTLSIFRNFLSVISGQLHSLFAVDVQTKAVDQLLGMF